MSSGPTHVALSQLSVDTVTNVRKTGRGAEPQFTASIREKGIIEPLVVRQHKGNGKFTITNGSKRFDALMFLKEKGDTAHGCAVTDAYPVPIIIRQENDTDARDTSLITNIVRSGMHPVDEAEAFAEQVRAGRTPAAIALTYGIDERRVRQRLALGDKLSPDVRQAWREDKIDDEQAEALTLAPDKKAQEAVLAKIVKGDNFRNWDADEIARAFKIKGEVGQLLELVGIAAYEARKGKVTLDLFGTNHQVSDEKLLRTMASEKLDAIADDLVKKDGWAWAKVVQWTHAQYDYGRIASMAHPTPAERDRLRELQSLLESDRLQDGEYVKLESEHETIEQAVLARSFTPEQRGKSGCFVAIEHGDLKIDYGRTKPQEKAKIAAQERAAERKETVKKATKGTDSPSVISNALHQRMSEQLTHACATALAQDPELALSAILAGFLSQGDVVCVSEDGLASKKARFGGSGRGADFAGSLQTFISKPKERLGVLAQIAGKAVDMQVQHIQHKPLANKGNVALIDAMKAASFNEAIRKAFDAKDYFDNVAKPLVLKAITEAVNAEEARKVQGKPKGEIAKFAVANVPKTGWLPPQLRTTHYDGPGSAKNARKKR